MPEEIKHREKIGEGGLNKETERKISEHLSHWREKELHLFFRDGVFTALSSSKETQGTSLSPNSKEFQELKAEIYENDKKAVKQLKSGKPGKELIERLNRPGRNEEEIEEIIKTYSNLLKTGELEEENRKKYVEEKLDFFKKELSFYVKERQNLLEKIGNSAKED